MFILRPNYRYTDNNYNLFIFYFYFFSENLCPITLDEPAVIKEFTTLDLSCSTLISCPSSLQLSGVPLRDQSVIKDNQKKIKKIAARITASWNYDEREISCQTENNQDPYLIQRINLTVECELRNREFAVW